jgi:hypothetical protein
LRAGRSPDKPEAAALRELKSLDFKFLSLFERLSERAAFARAPDPGLFKSIPQDLPALGEAPDSAKPGPACHVVKAFQSEIAVDAVQRAQLEASERAPFQISKKDFNIPSDTVSV